MPKAHYFLATGKDVDDVLSWLNQFECQSAPYIREKDYTDSIRAADIFHYHELGELVFWEDNVDYKSSFDKKAAIFARRFQQENPGIPTLKLSESPCAIFHYPTIHGRGVYRCSSLHFTPKNQNKVFPELHKISLQFGRWLRKNKLVYSWDGKKQIEEFPEQILGFSGSCIKVYALLDALEAIGDGEIFLEENVSPKKFEEYTS